MQRYGPRRATAAERPRRVSQMRPGGRSTPQYDSPVAQEGGGPMTPASPAETATPRPWTLIPFAGSCARGPGIASAQGDVVHTYCSNCLGDDLRLTHADGELIVEAVNAYDALRAAACPDPTLHAVADAPLRPLSDLLRTATEFDEIAGHLVDEYDLLAIELARIDALRAAVRALQGPPAPFRPQQAHAAPANGGES